MGFFDKLAAGVNGALFNTEITDGVRGTARVTSASSYDNDPTFGGGVYQNCHIQAEVEAPGIPATAVTIKGLVHQQKWPVPGAVLPALIERTNPQLVKILWDEAPEAAAGAAAVGTLVAGAPGTTVNIVGDVSKLTPEQKEKLKAMGVDVDALGGGQA
ncbi:MAG: hypothetical protein ABIQ01_01610 [Pseudolysinimonas sp.]